MVWEFHTPVFYDAKNEPEIWVGENSNPWFINNRSYQIATGVGANRVFINPKFEKSLLLHCKYQD